jgi:general nucleoside transport system ATP-binding protein
VETNSVSSLAGSFTEALIAENPTRGLDIQASLDVRTKLAEVCSKGVAVVFYSTDLEEILSISDRVLVVYNGSVREVVRDADLIGRAMLGAA